MWETLIGVLGTLGGTVLGWFLGKAKKGNLKIEFGNLYKEHAEDKNDGTSMPIKRYSFKVDLKLYNSGDKPTVARDFEVSFRDNDGKEILRKCVYDDIKTNVSSNRVNNEVLNVINISGLSGLDLKALIIVSHDNVDIVKKAKSLYLVYKNDKFKEIQKKICDKEFGIDIQNLIEGERNG